MKHYFGDDIFGRPIPKEFRRQYRAEINGSMCEIMVEDGRMSYEEKGDSPRLADIEFEMWLSSTILKIKDELNADLS